ncbi:MAG: RagB/SusD family nutrient uptake outer membrane protein [Bacteroidales bacterium]|nr:RagB/SusD family nutrient uptake outer membrane protein [Bacteroidales bacterium]
MKKIFRYFVLTLLIAGTTVSCDKFFDDMEGDLSKVAAEDMIATESGLLSLLANLYSGIPMNAFSTGDQGQLFANGSRSTPSYYSSTSSFWSYGTIRSINKFLEALDGAQERGIITEQNRNAYYGEGLFLRAYCYFAMVRTLGGIPIVDHSLDDQLGGDNAGLYFPRSTEKETWDWVLDQLQQAAEYLPETQEQEMRVTKYTALGMKARVALWAASESKYWSRAPINSSYVAVQKKLTYMEDSYKDNYYAQAIEAAEAVIKSERYKLYQPTPGSIKDAVSNLVALFQGWKKEEGLLGRSYVTGDANDGNGVNGWSPNQVVTGYMGAGAGSYAVTLNLADEYDYYAGEADRSRKDGKIQTLNSGDENVFFYDVESEMSDDKVASYKKYDRVTEPFELKDARFQAWVVYPGVEFRGKTIYMQGGYVDEQGSVHVYPKENDALSKFDWTTFAQETYYPYGGALEDNSFFYRLKDDTNGNNRSFYCFTPRKYLDQNADNANTQTPWYDLRYAEVLLTYAEAVVESGKGDKTLAAKGLNEIRHRAGFTDDVELTLANVLHEWKVEFAFENKWSDVLYRRRAFYNPDNNPTVEEGSVGQKLTLIPLVDLSGASAKYIFLRALPYSATSAFHYSGTLRFINEDYYGAISNYANNRIEENNK